MAAGCHCRPLWFNLFLAAANYKFFAKFRPHELLSDMLPGMDLENTVQMNRSPDPVNDQNEEAANKQALDYLRTIDFKTLGKTVFTDNLVTVSEAGKEIGELTISVEETTRGGEICYLVHAHSHGTLDGVPCGTSVTDEKEAFVSSIKKSPHHLVTINSQTCTQADTLEKESR